MYSTKNENCQKIFEIIKNKQDIDIEWAIKELNYIEEHELSGQILNIYNICKKKNKIGNKNPFNSYILYLLETTSIRPYSFIDVKDRRTYARSGFPDIDMDFDHELFDKIEQYAIEKYGEDYFGKIGTHQHISVKLAVRRAIKVLDPGNFSAFDKDGKIIKDGDSESYKLEQLILKTLPDINGQLKKPDGTTCQSVKEAYDLFSEFRRYMDQYPEVYRIACRLNGNLNAFATHAGGRILSPIPLSRICPLHYTSDSGSKNKTPATQFSMNDVESLGLIKFDFLRIATRSVYRYATQMIEERYGTKIDLSDLPLDDKVTLNLINSGKTDGIFQLEEYGMKQAIQMIGIKTFEDLSIAIAMYRPGPKDYIPKLAQCKKNPKSVTYIHPIVEKHTKSTFSIIVFQEQVMNIYVELAGLTNVEGYQFIKGAAKKKPELFMSMKERFIKGASKIASPEIAEAVFQQMQPFCGYAFNKCLAGDTLVLEENSKNIYKLKDLSDRKDKGKGFVLESKIITQEIINSKLDEIVEVFETGEKEIYTVELDNGMVIECTLDHKFLCSDHKFRTVRDIFKGDYEIIYEDI